MALGFVHYYGPIVGTCALCRTSAKLCDSHVLPKSLYRLMHLSTHKNPNPNLVTQGFVGKTSRQVRSHLLCPVCEKRFDENGEKWVMRNCYRGKGVFRLREMLEKAQPIEGTPEAAFFGTTQCPGVDYQKLAYFAMSVYWRGSLSRFGESVATSQLLNIFQANGLVQLSLDGKWVHTV